MTRLGACLQQVSSPHGVVVVSIPLQVKSQHLILMLGLLQPPFAQLNPSAELHRYCRVIGFHFLGHGRHDGDHHDAHDVIRADVHRHGAAGEFGLRLIQHPLRHPLQHSE